MCYMIEWLGVGLIQTQGDLDKRVPSVKMDGGMPFEPETCLCPVDVPATLDAAGVTWSEQRGIPEYRVHRHDNASQDTKL